VAVGSSIFIFCANVHLIIFRSLQGFLLPGEETTLRLTIFVSPAIAAPLNLRQQSLSTLLIVHTLFGQDLFLAVGGEYGTVRSL